MDVILTQKIDHLGEAGQTVSVARGYARNYLIPKGLAVVASEGNRRMMAERARWAERRAAKLRQAAEEQAAGFKDVSCTIQVQASEDDKLYGAVHEKDIAEALAKVGHTVDAKQIRLEEPIKQLGVYTVPVVLHEDVVVEVKVWVVRAGE